MVGLALIACVPVASARPVSYAGGWTSRVAATGDDASVLVHYSPTAQEAIGLLIEQDWRDDVQFTGLQYTRLVKRWNAPKAQANLYAIAAAGRVSPFGPDGAAAGGFVGVMADWETRRWFLSYEARAIDYLNDESAEHMARVGVAPYIGDFGDLHTWFMVQVDNHPDADTPLTTTPLVRLFKGTQMLELGYTVEEEAFMFNWTVRY
jgi:hypothetical protein